MAAKKPAKKLTSGVMDVSKPGKTTPDASARPIIVGHKPMTEDPMVTKPVIQDREPDDDPGEKIKVSRSAPKVIKPLSAADATQAEEAPKSGQPPAEKPIELPPEPESPKVDKPEELAEETPVPAPEPTTDEEATVGAVANQAPDKKAMLDAAEDELKQQEHLNELIANKKYYLPIRPNIRRRSMRWLLLILVIVILGGGGYIAYSQDFDLKRPSWLGGQTEEETPEHEMTTERFTKSAKPVTASANDTERRADINAIANALESYQTVHGYYPSLGELNDPNFRTTSFSLDAGAFEDPEGASSLLAVTTSSGMYGYAPTPANCDNTKTNCTAFTLSATLSDDSSYEKTSF